MTTEKPIYKVCEDCGAFEVQCDAYASWNPQTQKWELSELFQQEYCTVCEGETNLVDLHEGDEFEPICDPEHPDRKPFRVVVVDGWPEAWLLGPCEDPWNLASLVKGAA